MSDVVDPWLGEALSRLREFEFTRRGYREVEPFAAALRVLYEFSGVRSADAGPGGPAGGSRSSFFRASAACGWAR